VHRSNLFVPALGHVCSQGSSLRATLEREVAAWQVERIVLGGRPTGGSRPTTRTSSSSGYIHQVRADKALGVQSQGVMV